MPEVTLLDPVPGQVVPSGSLVSPGGPIGGAGGNAWTLTTAAFVVPNVGSSVVASVSDTRWCAVGEYVYVSSGDALQVTGKTATTLTLLNPQTSQNSVSANTGNLLTVGTDGLVYLPPSAIQPVIWNARLRSLNILGNPTMEVDQRHCGTAVAMSGTAQFIVDRWGFEVAGTQTYSCQQQPANVAVPATSFYITQNFLRATLTTQEPTPSKYAEFYQNIEGPAFREILGDVFSVSMLVRSSIANLGFGCSIIDNVGDRVLGKWCTLGAANTWTLVQLPNLPSPASSGGGFPLGVGAYAAGLYISLANNIANQIPANDTWQTISPAWNSWAAKGTYTFSAGPVNSTFDIAYVQLEPGPTCTTLIEKTFFQNLTECTRFYQKSIPYNGQFPVNGAWMQIGQYDSTVYIRGNTLFSPELANVPTVVVADVGGTMNSVYIGGVGLANVSSSGTTADRRFIQAYTLSVAPTITGFPPVVGQWQADTGF